MTPILGLDISPDAVGWALINWDKKQFTGNVIDMGCRIIPIDADILSKFESGISASENAVRRQARGARRMRQRYKLRRQRLIAVLKLLGWLPADYVAGHKLPVSPASLEEMKEAFGETRVSDDWLVYYLRHKALTEKIELGELARILYHMNQRRGFKSNRKTGAEIPAEPEDGDEQKKRDKKIEVVNIVSIADTGTAFKGNTLFKVQLKDGRTGEVYRKTIPEWKGEVELEITTVAATKKEPQRYEFRMPDKTDWARRKEALEKTLKKRNLFAGDYYYRRLTKNTFFRIRNRVVDRKVYEAEINAILAMQYTFYPELEKHPLLPEIAALLYPHNQEKQREIKNATLIHVLLNDIIYYQRPLRSQKNRVAECRYEKKGYRKPDGKLQGVKVAPASSPLYQEFRIWQTINAIRIFQREYKDDAGRLWLDYDVTDSYLTADAIARLYVLFDNREKLSQKQLLKELGNLDEKVYVISVFRGNEYRELPGNETKALLRRSLKRAEVSEEDRETILADATLLFRLWHLLYSLDEQVHIEAALQKAPFAFTAVQAAVIAGTTAFRSQYAGLSTKAMKKLLPLMHNGMSAASAAQAVYGIQPEKEAVYWEHPGQITLVQQQELKNPIVTQVINEALRIIREVWQQYGRPWEVHVALAPELKKKAQERAEMSRDKAEQKRDNERAAAILRKLNPGNPVSLSDIEKLKLWERQGDAEARDTWKDVRFKRPAEPTAEEMENYQQWCQKKHVSPYSGAVISLAELFTPKYQVDHIMPRSRCFDDSFHNKVVVEATLNAEKDNMTAYEYIKRGSARGLRLLTVTAYEAYVKETFSRKKRRLLLSETVPESMLERRLNDGKQITRKLQELLSAVAGNRQCPVVISGGIITHELKSRWGLINLMKEQVKWRFERLETKTDTSLVHYIAKKKNSKSTGEIILVLDGYDKRIDHRHHALDALVVACTTRNHIQYINTLHAQANNAALQQQFSYLLDNNTVGKAGVYQFRQPWEGFTAAADQALAGVILSFRNHIRLLGYRANRHLAWAQNEEGGVPVKKWIEQTDKKSPYVRQSLHKATFAGKIERPSYEKVITINEALELPQQIADPVVKKQIKEALQAADHKIKGAKAYLKVKPLKDQAGNAVNRIFKMEMKSCYVTRATLDESFDLKKIAKIPDQGLVKQLAAHLEAHKNDPRQAFNEEGLEALNQIRDIPVSKVSLAEDAAGRFEISPGKWVEADKGTNLFMAIYEKINEPGKREYVTIPLRTVIAAKQAGHDQFAEKKEGYQYFLLSPNDLVYMPDEAEDISTVDWNNDRSRIAPKVYKLVSVSKAQAFFVPHTVADVIAGKVEFDSMNKVEKSLDGRMIKQYCIKLKVTRLGHVSPAVIPLSAPAENCVL